MNTAALSAWFQQNKTEVMLVGGAAVAGLALFQKKKGTAGAASAAATAGAVAPGTMPAAAVVSAGGADSSAWSAYNSLQDEIGSLAQQNEAARQTASSASGASSGVQAPIASSLFSPSFDGNYWHMGSGMGEFESDGSMLVFSPDQWTQAAKSTGYQVTDLGATNVPGTSWTSTAGNLVARNKAITAAQAAQTSGA